VDKPTAEHLFEVINAREEVLRRLIRKCTYLKYVEARLGDRTFYADEILRNGFCINMIDTPLCPLKVVTNLQEAVWDADIVVNVLPSTETRPVFQQIGRFWRERRTMPVIISLAKGVEAALKTLVLYSQDPSSSYGTTDKGQRECLFDCLCAGCGFVIKSSNCNHAFP